MNTTLSLPIAVPLLGAALALITSRRVALQRIIAAVSTLTVLGVGVALVIETDRRGAVASTLGGWDAPLGITLIADRFSAIVLTVSAAMLVAVLGYAISQLGSRAAGWSFFPKYMVLTAGVAMSLLTGDLFNLFVGFEVMLIASYVLLTVRTGKAQIRATMSYVVINLLASALFLTAIGFVYGATGTVNMADLSLKLADLDPSIVRGLSLFTLVVFGVKAALFPLFMWLPDSYPTAPAPVTAIFAGLLTKVGVFVIIRTQTLLFPAEGPSTLLLTVAGTTMAIGVLGAIAQNDVKRILSFHIVSQIGYMIMGLGFLTVAGLAAAIVYITHHIVVKTGLFLIGGIVEAEAGTSRLDEVSGLVHRRPVLAVLFLPLALSLAGIPPFSGFVAKLALIQEGVALGRWVIVGVGLAVGLLTLFSMTKIWGGAFWGEAMATLGSRRGMWLATGLVVGVSLGISAFAGAITEFATRAAVDLLDPNSYVSAVLGGGS